ncbi:MAG: DNA polymerase III subunit alpha [Candidatus Latescibacteria bacterium]|nr:DNA polymerase III subunit alpha [Candidatus Latescibacterota bacterium]
MYAELKCKTNFSFLMGASHPEELVDQAAEMGLGGLGIADRNGVYAIPKAYWQTKEHPGLKLIVGAELTLSDHPFITLLARDRAAYGVLCRLLTLSHAGKEKGQASLEFSQLIEFMNTPGFSGLICLPDAGANYEYLREIFAGRLYVPVSRFKDGFDEVRVKQALRTAGGFALPLVATNEVLYHLPERRPLQDVISCIREKTTLLDAGYRLLPNRERHLKSQCEMAQLFADLPEALRNTEAIAESCTFCPSELRYRYPSEWIPARHTAQSYLEERVWAGARERYPGETPADVNKQLRHELELIGQLGYADYFLTIYDIVDFARRREILCQGRGSAANSAVCYCLGITAIDPVRMNLLFERFMSVERNEPPDIDVDFEHERREEVLQYVYEKYGRDRAAMVSAVITYRHRSALREVAKAFGVEVGTLSAKEVARNFDALSQSSPIADCKAQTDTLAGELEGFPRHLSIHSGGFTLSADPIIEIVPVEPARMEGRTIIQWDKYDLDYLGLLKVDLLALGMLSALRKTLGAVGLQLQNLPAEDSETYKMIRRADTVGTFQIESRAQMNMSGRLQPRNFYDLVIQVAIVRPGPIVGKMVHPYLKRRHGLEVPEYPHPKLREILGRTLGVPIFQEQVMKIAIALGGFTPGEADALRRAIGSWRSSGSIHKVGEKLHQGLLQHGVPLAYADNIFEQLKGFAHYGFPESHAASFALLSYASCYLKCHYPAEFACALINSQPMGFYATHTIVDDVRRHGVKVLPVDPNLSPYDCVVEGGALRLGLRSIRGLAKKDAEELIGQRPFLNLADFLERTELREDVLQRLALGDAFAGFGRDQRQTLWQLLAAALRRHAVQLDFIAALTPECAGQEFRPLGGLDAISLEYQAYGLSAKGHPMAELRKIRKLPEVTTFYAKRKPPGTTLTVSGLLLVRQRPPTAKGVCFATLEDEHGFLDLVLFANKFEELKEVFLHHSFLIAEGRIERDGHSVSLIVDQVAPIFAESGDEQAPTIDPRQYFW